MNAPFDLAEMDPYGIEHCKCCGAPRQMLPTIRLVQATVAHFYSLPVSVMTSDCRKFEESHPRQLAMYLCKKLMPLRPYTSLGRYFGDRDHSTVILGIRSAADRISVPGSPDRRAAETIEAWLRSRVPAWSDADA